jgi:hypothetical protein
VVRTLTDTIGRIHIMVTPVRRFIGRTATGFITVIIGTTGTGAERLNADFNRRVETPAGYFFGDAEIPGAELDEGDCDVS